MALIHHLVVGSGLPPIVFVHGFGCSSSDWLAQVEHFSPRHMTLAVDLPGHGATPPPTEQASIALGGREVAALVQNLCLPPAVFVGHSMGCRVVLDAALRVPERVAAIVLLDGSRFPAHSDQAFESRFAAGEYLDVVRDIFGQMFTASSDPKAVGAVLRRALAVSEQVGKPFMLSMVRYDAEMLASALERVDKPLLVLQTTFINDQRQRTSMAAGQTTPYLEFIRSMVPGATIETLAGLGHFPQIEAPAMVNRALATFIATLA
jgi:pimeloyl-ACP methyl ester carboxylesterase